MIFDLEKLNKETCFAKKAHVLSSLVSDIEKAIGYNMTCYSEQDIDKIKAINVNNKDIDLFIPSFIVAKNANKGTYISNLKSFLINGMDNQIKTHFSYYNKNEYIGAILFKFDSCKSNYIPAEAPLDVELFINFVNVI